MVTLATEATPPTSAPTPDIWLCNVTTALGTLQPFLGDHEWLWPVPATREESSLWGVQRMRKCLHFPGMLWTQTGSTKPEKVSGRGGERNVSSVASQVVSFDSLADAEFQRQFPGLWLRTSLLWCSERLWGPMRGPGPEKRKANVSRGVTKWERDFLFPSRPASQLRAGLFCRRRGPTSQCGSQS